MPVAFFSHFSTFSQKRTLAYSSSQNENNENSMIQPPDQHRSKRYLCPLQFRRVHQVNFQFNLNTRDTIQVNVFPLRKAT